jgi:hypothetical protein
MRVRDHIALSTSAAAAARPWLGNRAIGLWAGGVLVDLDHYVWFCAHDRRSSPRAAMRFFNQAHPPSDTYARILHNPVVPLALLVLGLRRRTARAIAVGVATHIALDAIHDARMQAARTAALQRDAFACQACGARAAVETHLRSQPWVMPSYSPRHLVALCEACHEEAHAAWN